jgi:hypothetical protein
MVATIFVRLGGRLLTFISDITDGHFTFSTGYFFIAY